MTTRRGARQALLLALLAPLSAHLAAAPAIIAWTYIVQPGDTLDEVAARMGVSPLALAATNGLHPDAPLVPGSTLKRPDPTDMPSQRPVRRPAPPLRPAPTARPAPPVRPMPEIAPAHRPEPGMPRLIWPTSGAVSSRFGPHSHGKTNNGIDLRAFSGMPVHAAAAGKVIFAGTETERFGQLIIIDHGNGWATAYAYLGKVGVREGRLVKSGEVIARIGSSGEATAPTLHFELRKNNLPVDPLSALPLRL
ncbi:peptidase M23B [Novosphingobium nitrogenifigens DSM 19370]|uniref:Peptidase M23B n=1 Tax=Novosphingobium nitrogenifigens DSM 19370 TaxID=983920 RepID=F1Z602_9SPHN|nr:M23 family metallopeptidase [Novosphingobium nitrogenifigens]EGD59966.1 peptidase M23B [Novosphingobium nitrogenifigens DSM 19370]